jgi:hypothetical protein
MKDFIKRFLICCEIFLLPRLSLPRIAWFLFLFASAAFVAHRLEPGRGLGGYLLGLIIGFFGSFLIAIITSWGLFLLFYPCPVCKRGRCRKYTDYVWRKLTFFGYTGFRDWRFACSCEDEYIFDGVHFMFFDGRIKHRYKKLGGFRKWVDDGSRTEISGEEYPPRNNLTGGAV